MFGFLKKRAAPDRGALLSGVMVRNKLVEERGRTEKALRLAAPLRPSVWKRLANMEGLKKTFELDDLGMWCWDRIDGKRTVEGLIGEFAKEKRVNVREAEVSVLAFLKMLTQRNLVAVVGKEEKAKTTKARKARNPRKP